MSRPIQRACEKCGVDITMDGSPVCPMCDPDVMAIVLRKVESKTPKLCNFCFESHMLKHRQGSSEPYPLPPQ